MRQHDDHADHAEHADHAASDDGAPATGPRAPACPFCGAADAELISLFGSQLLTEQYYCRACHTPFEHVKADDSTDAVCEE